MGKDRNGFVLVMMTFALVFLEFVALGLTVDIGLAWACRIEAQAAADAAALSGASALVGANVTEMEVKDKAVAAANANKIMGRPIAITARDVTVDMAARRLTVRVNPNMRTFFGRVLGIDEVSIGAVSVADAERTSAGASCLKPFVIPAQPLSREDPCMALNNNVLLPMTERKGGFVSA